MGVEVVDSRAYSFGRVVSTGPVTLDAPTGEPTCTKTTSRSLAQRHHREVDLGLGDFVDVVRPGVKRHVLHDLDHLGVGIARGLDRFKIPVAHVATELRDPGSEADRCVRLWI